MVASRSGSQAGPRRPSGLTCLPAESRPCSIRREKAHRNEEDPHGRRLPPPESTVIAESILVDVLPHGRSCWLRNAAKRHPGGGAARGMPGREGTEVAEVRMADGRDYRGGKRRPDSSDCRGEIQRTAKNSWRSLEGTPMGLDGFSGGYSATSDLDLPRPPTRPCAIEGRLGCPAPPGFSSVRRCMGLGSWAGTS